MATRTLDPAPEIDLPEVGDTYLFLLRVWARPFRPRPPDDPSGGGAGRAVVEESEQEWGAGVASYKKF